MVSPPNQGKSRRREIFLKVLIALGLLALISGAIYINYLILSHFW
ncbi:MAG: hypothetical protein AB1896_08160 [Thermodesulfobacteriota bacterium]